VWFDGTVVKTANAGWVLSRIQDEYLTDACGIYYTTSTTTELVGTEARRQLDFFIKRRTDAVDTSHDWKDVRIIGEHRVSRKDWKNKFLQIGRYVRDVFSVQPIRRFFHAFTLLGNPMELWVFDRSGPYSYACANLCCFVVMLELGTRWIVAMAITSSRTSLALLSVVNLIGAGLSSGIMSTIENFAISTVIVPGSPISVRCLHNRSIEPHNETVPNRPP
jgi:Fungal protein kinase